jgi:hypothetical protein
MRETIFGANREPQIPQQARENKPLSGLFCLREPASAASGADRLFAGKRLKRRG